MRQPLARRAARHPGKERQDHGANKNVAIIGMGTGFSPLIDDVQFYAIAPENVFIAGTQDAAGLKFVDRTMDIVVEQAEA